MLYIEHWNCNYEEAIFACIWVMSSNKPFSWGLVFFFFYVEENSPRIEHVESLLHCTDQENWLRSWLSTYIYITASYTYTYVDFPTWVVVYIAENQCGTEFNSAFTETVSGSNKNFLWFLFYEAAFAYFIYNNPKFKLYIKERVTRILAKQKCMVQVAFALNYTFKNINEIVCVLGILIQPYSNGLDLMIEAFYQIISCGALTRKWLYEIIINSICIFFLIVLYYINIFI